MDPLWLTVAFTLGLGARQVGLPPLVGFLLAGFGLNAAGASGGPVLDVIADLGVILLLFTIGLKLQVRDLLRAEIWAGTLIHMLVTMGVFSGGLLLLASAGVDFFGPMGLKTAVLVAFALSFSSTVFAVKVLEERGEMASFHGRVAIGILIMQDILAVVFLTASKGVWPSPWALALIPLLLAARPLMHWLLDRAGHGELMTLCGFFLALVIGAAVFDGVGLKADLGALIAGVLLSGHPKSSELAKAMMGFKDLFLVGFFLSIGLGGLPTLDTVVVALCLTLVMPFKAGLFFLLLTRFRLRARTGLLTAFGLANYSEFGLVVGAIAVKAGWIGQEWLTVIALALSATFVAASPLNTHSHVIYRKLADRIDRFQTATRHPDDAPLDPGTAQAAIFGMGRLGTAAYDAMRQRLGDAIIGVDFDAETVQQHTVEGRRVIFGDPTDPDFWARVPEGRWRVRLAMLAMPQQASNLAAAKHLRSRGFEGLIAATAVFDDELGPLEAAGADAAYSLYREAGAGFTDHALEALGRAEAMKQERSS